MLILLGTAVRRAVVALKVGAEVRTDERVAFIIKALGIVARHVQQGCEGSLLFGEHEIVVLPIVVA